MRLNAGELTADDVTWLELAGHESVSLAEAWRRVHYACLAVAEVGKAFAEPAPDGSHAGLRWFDGAQFLDGFFGGPIVGTNKRVLAALRLWDMHLFVISEAGEAIGELGLEGHTPEQAAGWIVDSVLNILDEPVRQATETERGLPDHALGTGAEFGPTSQFPQAELIRLYANANSILSAAAAQLGGGPVLTRPGPFDIGVAVTHGRAEIRLGLSPPDAASARGYWYVSGVVADHPKLAFGCWNEDASSGGSALAVLDLVDLHGVEDVPEQRHRVGTFLSEAFNICTARHGDG